MKNEYKALDSNTRQEIASMVAQRRAVTINYKTDLSELLTVTAMIKEVIEKEQAEYVLLTTGEEIRLDRIVRINDKLFPDYKEYDFGNSCSL